MSKVGSPTKVNTSKQSLLISRSKTSVLQSTNVREISKFRTVKITIESCENITSFFPTADIQAKCILGDNIIGISRPIAITDAKTLSVDYTFEFKIDQNSTKDLDMLVSYPAFLLFDQIQGTLDRYLYPQLQANELIPSVIPVKSFDSIVSLYEALDTTKSMVDNILINTGSPINRKRSKQVLGPKGGGSKASLIFKERSRIRNKESKMNASKDKKSASKSSLSTKKNSRSSVVQSVCSSVPSTQFEPTAYGMCVIDFLPLVFGQKMITHSMLIKPIVDYQDEKMNSYKSHPRATITLWTEDDIDIQNPMFLNFTLETIYNIPLSQMSKDQDYKLCCMMPMLNGQKTPIVFSNPVMTSETSGGISKCWPGIPRIGTDSNTTQYRTPDDLKDINAKFNPNVEEYIKRLGPRLQFAMIKRHILLRDAVNDIAAHVKIYRQIVLELLVTSKPQTGTGKRSSVTGTRTLEGLTTPKSPGKPSGPYLHCMALLNISTLLYPGVTKVRVAAPLTTFSMEEAAKNGGLEDSFFFPTGKDHSKTSRKDRESLPTEKEKQSRDETATGKSKSPMRTEENKESTDPVQVYDEEGRPCFVVVEIDLTHPLIPPKDIEDLTDDLSKLIIAKNKVPTELSKVVLTSCITTDHYKEALNAMVNDLNKKYLVYTESKPRSPTENGETHLISFVEFLKKSGSYESYVNSISKIVLMVISKKYQLNDISDDKQYHKLISDDVFHKNIPLKYARNQFYSIIDAQRCLIAKIPKIHKNKHRKFKVFVYLVSQMNETVNKLMCHGMEPVSNLKHIDKHFFYAKEAMETGRQAMAERYLLERICNHTENADYWFDYAIYLLQIKEDEKAFECIKEALSKQMDHKYSLLTLGVLLSGRGQNEDAETCFLNLMEKEFSWMEGWAVLYLFYLRSDNFEGSEMAMEMAKKYLELAANEQDEFMEADDLVWTKAICPNTIFFRTASLLLKCRCYEWAELALSQEIYSNPGIVHYLLSAICYYKQLYVHALEHIQESNRIYGPDYAVASLAGHCYVILGMKNEAKEQYYWAMEFFNRPVSMHLASVQLSTILVEFQEDQEARKLALVACKYNPTPYTWLLAGKLYYQQNDLLSAEECFSEGNSIDNRYAEIWGYLALVNAKLKRPSEAEICYTQAIRNKLDNNKLLKEIQKAMRNTDVLRVY